MSRDAENIINQFFRQYHRFFDQRAPQVLAETAVEYYKERFRLKNWDGAPWPPLSKRYKPKKGSMMIRTAKLMNSINSRIAKDRVVISAGNSRVPYAKIHNEGGEIQLRARSETFRRNRARGGRFKKGTSSGRGFSFRASKIRIPRRQFMGHSNQLNERIIRRFKEEFKF